MMVIKKIKPKFTIKKKGKFSHFTKELCPKGCGCKLAANFKEVLIWCSNPKCTYYRKG